MRKKKSFESHLPIARVGTTSLSASNHAIISRAPCDPERTSRRLKSEADMNMNIKQESEEVKSSGGVGEYLLLVLNRSLYKISHPCDITDGI